MVGLPAHRVFFVWPTGKNGMRVLQILSFRGKLDPHNFSFGVQPRGPHAEADASCAPRDRRWRSPKESKGNRTCDRARWNDSGNQLAGWEARGAPVDKEEKTERLLYLRKGRSYTVSECKSFLKSPKLSARPKFAPAGVAGLEHLWAWLRGRVTLNLKILILTRIAFFFFAILAQAPGSPQALLHFKASFVG